MSVVHQRLTGAVGQLRTLADAVTRTFERRLRPDNGPSRADDVGRVVGLCRHSGALDFTSAMWRIADGGGTVQLNGSFLHLRTHTPDPERTLGIAGREGPL